MGILNELTKKSLSVSELAEDKEKISTEEIIEEYENGITIDKIDIVVMNNKDTGIYTFKENKSVFAYAGHILTNLFKLWVDKLGSVEEVNKVLKTEKVKIKLEQGQTLDGNDITKVIQL